MALKVLIALILGSTVLARRETGLLQSLKTKLYQNKDNGDISQRCKSQMDKVLANPMIALQMFDSSTKIPEGIFSGRIVQLGDYDECINIKSEESPEAIFGKYCLGSYQTNALDDFVKVYPERNYKNFMLNSQTRGQIGSIFSSLSVAICVPSGCSPDEVLKILGVGTITFAPASCYSKDTAPELTWGPIFTIVFFCVFMGVAVVSTLYDIYLYYTKHASHPILTAFSVTYNMKKLLKASSNQDQLLCLNGIKALSMMWVIIGHQYSLVASLAPVGNLVDMLSWIENSGNMHIIGASVSVDTFFLVGGLVIVYTFLKAHKSGVEFNVPLYYMHRYLRLTPLLAVVVLFHATLTKYVSDGPLWSSVDPLLGQTCRDRWWTALLYIQNYVHDHDMSLCVPQSWYLSIDMQLFILSPLVLLPLVKWPTYTLCGLYALTGIGVIVPFVLGWVYDLIANLVVYPADMNRISDYMRIYYMQTYARFAPYVMGIILGYFAFKIKNKEVNFKLKKVVALWLISVGGMFACTYAGHHIVTYADDRWANSLYLAFNRPAWSFCVCLAILGCVSGYGGPIDKFLSHPVFQFLTKLSYSMYLVHYMLITAVLASGRYPIYFTDINLMYMFWGSFMFTLAISLVLCLLFESPVVVIEKVVFGSLDRAPANDTSRRIKSDVNSGV